MKRIIKRPLLTEKMSLQTENNNTYGFEVDAGANKHQIKSSVEQMFDVKVTSVHTTRVPGKLKRTRAGVKKSATWKKAYVAVADGQKIEMFKGI